MRIRTLERTALAALVAFVAGSTTLASPSNDGDRSVGAAKASQLSKAERKSRRQNNKKKKQAAANRAKIIIPTPGGSGQPSAAEQPQDIDFTVPYFPADLNSMKLITGELLDGELKYLAADDDTTIALRSGYSNLPGQLHLIETVLSATTDTLMPIAIAITLDARSSEHGCVILRLRNRETGEFDEIARSTVGPRSGRLLVDEISASQYISESGEIQVSLQQVVTIPLYSKTFQMDIDWLEIGVF